MFNRPINTPSVQTAVLLTTLLSLIFSSFIIDDKNPNHGGSLVSRPSYIPWSVSPPPDYFPFKSARLFDSDPIRFALKSNKKAVTIGEEIEITISAHYLNISPALLFVTAGSNVFRLKVLLPDGFVQTGGDYIDFIGAELSATKPFITYTLKGYLTKTGSTHSFRLLRSHANADAHSLFVEKDKISIEAYDSSYSQNKNARVGTCSVSSPNAAFDYANCDGIGGWALDQANMNQPVTIDIYVDGVKTYSDITANGDRPDLVGAFGNSAARYHGFNYSFPANAAWKNGQNHTISVRICGASGEINGSPKAVNGCTGGTANPPTGGGSGNGLLGNYFNNISLSGSPALTRVDATINFTWDGGGSSPFPGVNASNMSVRWEGQVEAPVSGDYTFSTNNDDATNLWVNGQQLINDWPGGHGPLLKSGTISLQAGQKYNIKLEFNQGSGGAQAQLLWAYLGQGQQIIPQDRLYSNGTVINSSSCGTGVGLTGFYSNSIDLSNNLVAIRTDDQINFTWNSTPISGIVNDDGFSVRWVGQIEAPVSGNYTFKTFNDDGTRLWINKQLLINDWNGHGPTWQQGSIYLAGGQKYDIVMDFFDAWGGAQAQLYWEYPGQNLQIVPSCRLYKNKVSVTPYTNPIGFADYCGECIIDVGNIRYFTRCCDGRLFDVWEFSSAGTTGGSDPNGSTGYVGVNVTTGGSGAPGGSSNANAPDINSPSNDQILQSKFYPDMASKGISFTDDEKSVLEQFSVLKDKVRSYADQYGSRPYGSNAFKMSLADQQAYPKFANLVKNNIQEYVMSRPKILNALKKFSGLSEKQIKGILTLNYGPTIIIEQLSQPEFWGQAGYVYGEFDADFDPNIIKIDKLTINRYELSNLLWPELESAYFTLLAQTLIHEVSHYGANLTQTIDYTDGENSTPNGGPYTHRFDLAAFGYPNNGSEVMRRKYILNRTP